MQLMNKEENEKHQEDAKNSSVDVEEIKKVKTESGVATTMRSEGRHKAKKAAFIKV